MIFIDTNILVYAFDNSDAQKHKRAEAILDSVLDNEKAAAVSTQTLSEFFVVVTSKITKPLPMDEARQIVNDLINLKHLKKLVITPQTICLALRLSAPYWDALIAATMLENHIITIYTENVKDFKNIGQIKIINPF